MPRALVALLGIRQHLRIELAIVLHRFLEDADRPRQRADLVIARGVRHFDIVFAVGNALDGGRDRRQGARDRASDDQDADHDHKECESTEAGQDEGKRVVVGGLLGKALAAFGVDLRERLEILVQRGANRAVGVIVAPFAARSRTDFDAATHQFLAKLDELLDALLEGGKLLGVVGLHQRLPVIHDVQDARVESEQPFAVFFHHRCVGRHVDAPGFHHHGINQRVDALDVQRGPAGGRHRLGQLGVAARVVIRQGGNGRGQYGKQAEDRIELGCERKPGGHAGHALVGMNSQIWVAAARKLGRAAIGRPPSNCAQLRWIFS